MLGQLDSLRAVARFAGREVGSPVSGDGVVQLGPLELAIADGGDGPDGWQWSVANHSDDPIEVVGVRLVWDAVPVREGARMLRHGYQSWSPTGVALVGVDRDPSAIGRSPGVLRGMHHADADIVRDPAELRSELVTLLDLRAARPLLALGFTSATEHDGTFRVRPGGDRVEVAAEAYLGGAVLASGERRELHPVWVAEGDEPAPLLEAWASRAGQAGEARVGAPYQAGWCSWYHYFHRITEDALLANLASADGWPFDVFQLDDGYQAAIGDWLHTNEKFPSTVEDLASAVAGHGRTPGIWMAPFLAAPSSRLATEHPEWVARWHDGSPLVGMVNDAWGGHVHVLDTTRPEVLAHLEDVAKTLVATGWRYLKLDFTYAPSLPGRYADASRTPAQRVRAGMEAIRRGAGGDTFILGCGLPLGVGIGVVDGMRIGPDVAPWWRRDGPAGAYAGVEPATVNAWRNTLSRSFQHRRLWLNDPDCLMLRRTETQMDEAAVRAWALAVAMSGGIALVSDDLALLRDGDRRLLDEVLELGREVDAAARSGNLPRCDDLLEHDPPARLSAAGRKLIGDPANGRATLLA